MISFVWEDASIGPALIFDLNVFLTVKKIIETWCNGFLMASFCERFLMMDFFILQFFHLNLSDDACFLSFLPLRTFFSWRNWLPTRFPHWQNRLSLSGSICFFPLTYCHEFRLRFFQSSSCALDQTAERSSWDFFSQIPSFWGSAKDSSFFMSLCHLIRHTVELSRNFFVSDYQSLFGTFLNFVWFSGCFCLMRLLKLIFVSGLKDCESCMMKCFSRALVW